jgi:hypothetical protein
MKKNYNLKFFKNLSFLLVISLISLSSYGQSFSPTVGVSLSNNNCGQLSDLSIDVSQDAGETDIASSVFTSDLGSLDLSSLIQGDTVGTATMSFISGTIINATLIVSQSNTYNTLVLADANVGMLGSFSIRNLSTGGIEITASVPPSWQDNNSTTGGFTSNATFSNLFNNPSVSVVTFSSIINSELGDVDSQSFLEFMSCADFSPSFNVTTSNNSCGLLTDLTIDVSQDAGEIDMSTALLVSDGGSFDLSSLSVGSMIGYATITTSSNSYTEDLFVYSLNPNNSSAVVNTSSGNTFAIENLSGGGVSITATSPGDNNYTTSGNSSSATFTNIFNNPSVGVLGFNSTITSEIGQVDLQSVNLLMSCSDFSPTVVTSLSNTHCDSLSSLTIDVSQDAGETDMASAVFVSDGGSYTLSSMTIGDNIGSAIFTNNVGSYSTGLFITNLTSNTATVSADSLGYTFALENLSGGGVSITATSPGDNNSLTSGNSSSVTFNNVFHNPNSGVLNFNSTITSELGEVDSQSFTFYMSCIDFSPTVLVSTSDNTCDVLTDLSIDVSQDGNEADIDSAVFVSDGGSFDISNNSLNDTVGTANVLFANGTNVNSNLVLITISSLDDFEVQSIDANGLVLGTFSVVNLSAGGVSIIATSPVDGNSSTNGYVSNATFTNLFVNPNTNPLNFTTTITSELGHTDVQSFSLTICCDPMTLVTVTACDSFDWDGVTYDSTGVYVNLYTDVNGCDSTVTLDLTINYSSSLLVTVTACDSFDWDGMAYDSTGTYTNLYTDLNGCDSTVTLDLTINYSSSLTVTVTVCDTGFVWDGTTYNSTGMYTNVYTDLNGCDSTVTLDLTVGFSESNTVTVTACDSFDWDGMTYDSTGMYTNVYTNLSGCDSTVTLDLTVGFSESNTVTVTACDSFDWDGMTYDSTGMYTNVYTNLSGCDSTVTLDLTINNSFSSSVVITSCDSFDWDGMTYDSTGMYTNVYTGLNGCDSTVTLDLTINNSSSLTVTITACDSFDWDGMTYDSTGMYTNLYTDLNGCDSIVTLDLTINNGPVVEILEQNGNLTANNIVGSLAPYTYEWSTGETSQTITPIASDTYWCIVSDSLGCLSDTAFYTFLFTSTIDITNSKVLIYPNPTQGILNIEFDLTGSKEVTLCLVNILGDVVYTELIDNETIKYSNKLDLSNYSNGIYFVKLKKEDSVITKKVILQ